jgi:RNA polymerase sigma-70 factor (ECF subfamily)
MARLRHLDRNSFGGAFVILEAFGNNLAGLPVFAGETFTVTRAIPIDGPRAEAIGLNASDSAPDRFEQLVLPHLDAAYNLARWLMRGDHDAEDVVQEAFLRAFRAFDQFHGQDPRAWVLVIVRNACFTALRRNRSHADAATLEDEIEDVRPDAGDPVAVMERRALDEVVKRAIEALPLLFREVFVMREIEGLSYRQIAEVIDAPIGTVMSRLSRARGRLQESLAPHLAAEASSSSTSRAAGGTP